jgi:hypothetical protein
LERGEEVVVDMELIELAKFVSMVELKIADQTRGGFERLCPVPERMKSCEKFMVQSKLDRMIGRSIPISEA